MLYRKRLTRLSLLVVVALLLSACQPLQLPVLQSTSVVPAVEQSMPASLAQPHSPRPDAPTYGVRGPYAVGVRDFVIEGTQEYSRSITVSVWYPASNPSGDPEEITYQMDITPGGDYPPVPIYGHALQDAAPLADGAPFPLVLYSHGAWSFRQSAAYLMEQLASYGFTVIAPDHVDNWGTLFQPTHAAEILRPIELRRALDYAEALTAKGGWLEGLIDMEHVAAAGWSFGGEEAMILGGARFNLDEFFAGCAEMDNVFAGCEYTDVVNEITQIAGLEALPTGLWPDWSDPRVDVVVALAPGSEIFGKTGTQMMDRPILLMVGSLDDSVGPGLRYFDTYEQLRAAHKSLVTIENASHIIFFNACAANPGIVDEGLYWVCSDPVWDMNRAHDLISHFATAFLLAELKDDADASKALAAENVNFPGIQYETTAYATASDIVPTPQLDEATIAKIEGIIQQAMTDYSAPGFAMCIVKDDQVVYSKGFGFADLASNRPATPQSLLLQASITKSLVAMAILRLAEQGKIDLDEPVTTYLPYFTMTDERYKAITVRLLLSHRAGLPDSPAFWTEPLDVAMNPLEQAVRDLNEMELLFAPDTDWSYSSYGYSALGAIIAQVTGQPFEQYMQEEWLVPLGMTHSTLVAGDVDPTLRMTLYGSDEAGKVIPTNMACDGRDASSCNLWSSCEDLVKWAQLLLHDGELNGTRFLQPESIQMMWTPVSQTPWVEAMGTHYGLPIAQYGLGWYVGEVDGHRFIGHAGGSEGTNAQFQLSPDDGLAVITMVNWLDQDNVTGYPASFAAFDVMYQLLGIEPE